MLKHGEVNPLNIHGLRQISWCPPHFEQLLFDPSVTEKVIADWIYENLSGRFYLGQADVKSADGRPTYRQMLVAFEHASEASYFGLCLPQINVNNVLW